MDQYDIIIAGSGAAGLSLAYYLSLSPLLQNRRILLIDKDLKQDNDRTWGFWTKSPTAFDEIVSFRFSQAEFISREFAAIMPLAPYSYQVIEGIHFYKHIKERLALFPNIRFLLEEISEITSGVNTALVRTTENTYQASLVFNSCLIKKEITEEAKKGLYLRQHFKGWVINTPQPCFDTGNIRLFDFRTPQDGKMRFFYLIPQSSRRALVEYTLFSADLLEPEAYDNAIEIYIKEVLQIKEYTITDREWGTIPMTTYPFPAKHSKRVLNIGTAGGTVKPSTGYTFLRIQQQSKQIIQLLEKQKEPVAPALSPPRFRLYDEMLLNIMDKDGGCSEEIFSQLFRNNPVQRIFKFLDEETTFTEELAIMNSVPRKKFIKSFLNLKLKTPFS